MTILADFEIAYNAKNNDMIHPFIPRQVKMDESGKLISSGLSSYGYDARLAPEFHIFKYSGEVLDPKNVNSECVRIIHDDEFILEPGEFALASTLEYFKIPDDCTAICLGKSTYARVGLIVNVTPLEAGWHGNVTLELSNTNTMPILIRAYEGICQFLFFRGKQCETTYADRQGKYMEQTGVTYAKV